MMRPAKLVQRFLLPSFVISLIYALRYGALISPRAEVELSPQLKLGKGTKISSFTKIKATDGPMAIGCRVSIGAGCFIHAGSGGLTIGDDSMISPNVSIISANYRYDRLDIPMQEQGEISKGVTIGRDVWIGVGCAYPRSATTPRSAGESERVAKSAGTERTIAPRHCAHNVHPR